MSGFAWTVHGDAMTGPPVYTSNQGHRIERVGKRCFLTHPDGTKTTLPKRATLDHAEKAIVERRLASIHGDAS